MNIIEFADFLKKSKLKHGKYFAALLYQWPLLTIFPILITLILGGYLNLNPSEYNASASFSKIANLDDEINSHFIKNLNKLEFHNFSVINKCISSESNTSPENITRKLRVVNVERNSYIVQLSVIGKSKNDAYDCVSKIFSAINDYQYKLYKEYISNNRADILEFRSQGIKAAQSFPKSEGELYKIEIYRLTSEKIYQLNVMDHSIERLYKNSFSTFAIELDSANRKKLLIGAFLLSLFFSILVALRNEFFLYIKSRISN